MTASSFFTEGEYMDFSQMIRVNDVMLRDGLQMEEKVLSVEQKLQLASMLIQANIKQIEFGSFVHPKLVPQMANSGELFQHLPNSSDIYFVALVPNLKGVELAASYGVPAVNFVLSASNTHNLQNVRQTTEQSLASLKTMKEYCQETDIKLDVSIATAFGCPFEGEVAVERVESIAEQLLENQVHRITLADTTGMANPRQVYELVTRIRKLISSEQLNLHFHNTRGMGLANVLAAIEAGATSFDAALGGLGGCPFAPGATGNISTEDVVHMLESMGFQTNIDLDQLLDAAKILQRDVGHELASSVLQAGKYNRKYPIPDKEGNN